MATALLFGLDACAQKTPEAYKLYDHAGKEITYQSLIKALSEPDVVFIGEMHNCVVMPYTGKNLKWVLKCSKLTRNSSSTSI